MLISGFIFLQDVGPAAERRWRQQGIVEWHHFLNHPAIAGLSAARKSWYDIDLPVSNDLYEQLVTRLGPAAALPSFHQPRQVS